MPKRALTNRHIKSVLRRAFREAHVSVEGLIDAYRRMPDDPVVKESLDFLAAMDAVSMHLLGERVQTLAYRFKTDKVFRVLPDGSLEDITTQPESPDD